MKIDKFDIGAEIISILTRGMYPDPRDAVREYIQNAIDASAPNVMVKVRQNSVVVEDDGSGMDYRTLRRALRVGVSDKKPGKDVGFMGIGIYSSFHLCDSLMIFTRQSGKDPQYLEMDFKGMRSLLKDQRDRRLAGETQSEDLVDLQSLLERFITLPDEGAFPSEEYPIDGSGTRVELVGLNPVLDDLLNNFDDLANYLQDVVPLPFDRINFKWAELIEDRIKKVVHEHKETFEIINLRLQVGSRVQDLFRPYTNDLFSNDNPLEPEIQEMKSGGIFLGIAWGCLNSSRERILLHKKDDRKRDLRGFIMKKQGFSIGTREMLSKYFGPSNTYYHRYTGEIIIVNKEILPNAARNDIEASDLKKLLYLQIQNKIAPYFVSVGSRFQEQDIAREVFFTESNKFNRILGQYNPYEDNYNNYLTQIGELQSVIVNLNKKLKKLPEIDRRNAELVKRKAEELKREIAGKFEVSKRRASSKKEITEDKATQIAKDLANVNVPSVNTHYEDLLELLEDLGFDFQAREKKLLTIIDEKYIKGIASSQSQYFQLLNELKSDFENGAE